MVAADSQNGSTVVETDVISLANLGLSGSGIVDNLVYLNNEEDDSAEFVPYHIQVCAKKNY